jgi:hypothetical protein
LKSDPTLSRKSPARKNLVAAVPAKTINVYESIANALGRISSARKSVLAKYARMENSMKAAETSDGSTFQNQFN